MKTTTLTSLVAAALGSALVTWAPPAAAWASANRMGGATQHSPGETAHENRWGGSSEHVAGEGTEHTNAYGGSTEHSAYGGTEHTSDTGTTTYGKAGYGAVSTTSSGASYYHPPAYGAYPAYPAYHPPVAVPYYSTGCAGCAVAAGAVVGMATGAAIASSNNAVATSNAYAAGVATGSANTAAAYQSGVAAGAALPASYPMGASFAALPPGSTSVSKNGQTYYLNGNTWFQPAFGANGVHYTVVPTP